VSCRSEVFPARMDAFPKVAAFAEQVCATGGVGRDDCLRLLLVLEELFTNTVVHGHGGDSDAPVTVALDVRPGGIGVTYEDTAPRFDPLAAVEAQPDPAVALDERPVGGLGLLLIARMAASLEYSRLEGRNRLALVVAAR